jgi:hypothetical protein
MTEKFTVRCTAPKHDESHSRERDFANWSSATVAGWVVDQKTGTRTCARCEAQRRRDRSAS